MNTNTEQRLYVACLASYNNGILHGEWIDAASDADEMQEEVNRILRASPYPNVEVDCPECEGMGEGEGVFAIGGEPETIMCLHCKGAGQVPSSEEWAIHDHEGLGDIGEYAGLKGVARRVLIVEAAEEANIPPDVLLEAMESECDDTDPVRLLENEYLGQADNWAEYAEDFHQDCGDLKSVPEWLKYHIDWESVGQEMQHSYKGIEHNGTLYVFCQ